MRRGRGDRLPVPLVLGTAVTRNRSSQAAEALRALSLVVEHAPEPARVAFRAELRGLGLAEPGDTAAPSTAVRSWARPDLYARAARTTVIPWLDDPELALAAAAIDVLTTPAARRQARPSPEKEIHQP